MAFLSDERKEEFVEEYLPYIKKYFWVILIGLVAGIYFFFSWWNSWWYIENFPSHGTDVIAFGDSLVVGVGSTPGNDFVSLLAYRFNTPIINAGVSGDTTAQALNRLHNLGIFQSPKVVIVLLGGNDYLQRIPKQETFNNLSTIVKEIQAHGAAVLLLGVRGGVITDVYDEEFRNLAKRLHAAFVPNVLDGLLGNSDLMSDGIHPNDKGYKIIADKVTPVLKKLLRE
ncbi:arylesterase [Candidatus Parcubacteria bacterium]|nr:arylesterase [Candidatus Parcubacteria bacterium]